MGEAGEIQPDHFVGQEGAKDVDSIDSSDSNTSGTTFLVKKKLRGWILVFIYALFLLAGQTVATILGRLYYDKGGNSKWLAGLIQPAGFPILFPLYLISSSATKHTNANNINAKSPSVLILASAYISLGILVAAISMMYSYGYLYLPVSTYSLICASQLGFNALFSFFLNSLKFTPFIINSLVLLTISSMLLIFEGDSTESNPVFKGKFAIGFICTLGASAGYGLVLSLTQYFLNKIVKTETIKVVLDVLVYPSIVSTCVILVGLFASGEWKGLRGEMEQFKLGKASYLMTLIWTAIGWQIFSIGSVGLICEVSSVFSNVISTLGLPIVPIVAVILFHDKMDGLKVIAMLLAIWGFVSYIYQHYSDQSKLTEKQNGIATEAPESFTNQTEIDEEQQYFR